MLLRSSGSLMPIGSRNGAYMSLSRKRTAVRRRNARKARRRMAISVKLCASKAEQDEKFENHAFIQSRVLSSTPCSRSAKGSKPTFSQMMPRKHPFRQPIAHSSNGFEGMHTGKPVNPRDILPRMRRC